ATRCAPPTASGRRAPRARCPSPERATPGGPAMFSLGVVDWLAIVGGLAAVAWIHWYFFRAERGVASASDRGGVQEVTIAVHGGYDPATVRVRAGSPVRLIFDRQET